MGKKIYPIEFKCAEFHCFIQGLDQTKGIGYINFYKRNDSEMKDLIGSIDKNTSIVELKQLKNALHLMIEEKLGRS